MTLRLDISLPRNGRIRKADVTALLDGKVLTTDRVDMVEERDRRRFARMVAGKAGLEEGKVRDQVEQTWAEVMGRQGEEPAAPAAGASHDGVSVEVLDAYPETVSRPLCLVGGRAYAAAWLPVQRTVREGVDPATGEVVRYDPPLVQVEPRLAVLRDDGRVYGDGVPLPGCEPLGQLGAAVRLPTPIEDRHAWSGAGAKRYLAGERPDPADVFRRVVAVVDAFMDFRRSLAKSQATMCELVACYVLASWLLDAFDVAGYLWPNGDKGAGKTNFLSVVCELAFLGQLILAGGSYAALRDLADYGATLAFDDAENVMDVRKVDPDKRALLLAGNRRGATVPVKELVGERWVTRHVRAFCPRLFSAIRLPDDVLASRTIIVPLVRSPDPKRAKRSVYNGAHWPHERRRLVDDLWAVGLAHLPRLKEYDGRAAERSKLVGRDLEPWQAVLAVALWLQDAHGVAGLFDRVETLSQDYQQERGPLQAWDAPRVAVAALCAWMKETPGGRIEFAPSELARRMTAVAREDEHAEEGEGDEEAKGYSPTKAGLICRKLRLQKGDRARQRHWVVTRAEVLDLAAAYGFPESAVQGEKEQADEDDADAF